MSDRRNACKTGRAAEFYDKGLRADGFFRKNHGQKLGLEDRPIVQFLKGKETK